MYSPPPRAHYVCRVHLPCALGSQELWLHNQRKQQQVLLRAPISKYMWIKSSW
jgi:hypothetical protein